MTSETRESLRTIARELELLASTLKSSGRAETAFILGVAKMALDEELYGAGVLAAFAAGNQRPTAVARS